MKNLIQLVENLKKSEVRLIRSLLEVQSLNQKSHKLELFNLIHSKMVKTNVDASMKIYQKKPHAVYYVLKSRLKGDIINGYNLKCTGMHMVTFKKSSIDILLNGRVIDSVLCQKVKNNKKLWVSTIYNKAFHLTWDLYTQKNDYYNYKKTKIRNGLIQNINNNNKYKVL